MPDCHFDLNTVALDLDGQDLSSQLQDLRVLSRREVDLHFVFHSQELNLVQSFLQIQEVRDLASMTVGPFLDGDLRPLFLLSRLLY